MRLIDADALKPHDQLEPMGNGKYEYVEVVYKNDIDDAPTIEAEPKWIPCSERLPEETGEYLTTTMYGDVFCDYWQSCNFNRTEMVIAWMPLPEPYKERT